MAATEEKRLKIVLDGQKADATLKEMQSLANLLNKELRQMPTNAKEFTAKAQEYAKIRDRISEINNQVRSFQQEKKKSIDIIGMMKRGFAEAGGAMLAAFSVSAIVQFSQKIFSIQAELSDLQADIRKTTGMSQKQVEQLTDSLKKLDTRTSLNNLLLIAKVGGQIGITTKEMLGFVESMDKASVALGDEFAGGVEEVAKQLGSLKSLFQQTKGLEAGEAYNKIGSAINALGAAGTATGDVVAEFTKRIGALGNMGPTITQTMGLGAALQELGLTAEIASGGLTNIFLKAGEQATEFAKHLKMPIDQFRQMLNTNPNEMLLKLAESFKGASNTQIITTLDRLKIGTQESIKVMSLLATQTDMVKEKQKLANVEFEKGTSLTEEFNIKNNTLAAQSEKAGKSINDLFINLGERLMPALRGAVGGFADFIGYINEFIKIPTSQKIKNEKDELNNLVQVATDANTTQAQRNALLKEIQAKYPDFLKNLNLETVTNNQLRVRLAEANAEYERRITLQLRTEALEAATKESVKTQKEILELKKSLNQANNREREWYEYLSISGLAIEQVSKLNLENEIKVREEKLKQQQAATKEELSMYDDLAKAQEYDIYLQQKANEFIAQGVLPTLLVGQARKEMVNQSIAAKEKELKGFRDAEEEYTQKLKQDKGKEAAQRKAEAEQNAAEARKAQEKIQKQQEEHNQKMERAEAKLAEARAKILVQSAQAEIDLKRSEFQKQIAEFQGNAAQEAEFRLLKAEELNKEIANIERKYAEQRNKTQLENIRLGGESAKNAAHEVYNAQLAVLLQSLQAGEISERQHRIELRKIQREFDAAKTQADTQSKAETLAATISFQEQILESAYLSAQEQSEIEAQLAANKEAQRQNDLANAQAAMEKAAEIRKSDFDLRMEDAQIEYETEQANIEERFADGQMTEFERREMLLEAEAEYLQSRLDMLNEFGEGESLQAEQLQTKLAQIDRESKKNRLEEMQRFMTTYGDLGSQILQSGIRFVTQERDEALQRSQEKFDGRRALINSELAELEASGQTETARYKQLKADLTQVEKDAKAEETRIKQEALEKQKRLQVAGVLIDLAKEIAGYFANPGSTMTFGVLGAIKAGIATARALLSIREINSQKLRKGGFIADGASHEGGGIKLVDGASGRVLPQEIEGGEAVISSAVVRRFPDLVNSLINAAPSMGNLRMFEAGGVLPAMPTNTATTTTATNDSGAEMSKEIMLGLLQESNRLLAIIAEKQPFLVFGDEELDGLERLQRERARLVSQGLG